MQARCLSYFCCFVFVVIVGGVCFVCVVFVVYLFVFVLLFVLCVGWGFFLAGSGERGLRFSF